MAKRRRSTVAEDKVHFSIIYCDGAGCSNSTTTPRFRSDGWFDFKVESRHGTYRFVICPGHFDEAVPSAKTMITSIAGLPSDKENEDEE